MSSISQFRIIDRTIERCAAWLQSLCG